MLIPEKPLKHWMDYFYGYGSWDAPIWFVDYEEGGGELPEEVAEKVNYFNTVHASRSEATLCEIRELYKQVAFRIDGPRAEKFSTLYDHRFGSQAVLHGVWKNIIAFVHGYRNKKLPDLLKYQKNAFANSNAHEAWIKLYPLPSPHNHAWYYGWLEVPQHLSFIRNRVVYQDHLYNIRMQRILEKIRAHKPDLVVMYGMDNINGLKKTVQEFFPDAAFKMVKGVKLRTPQHHRADFKGTTLLITTQIPALRHNRAETGFDWFGFGKLVKAGKG